MVLTFGIHAIRADVGDFMDNVHRRHWCFRELRLPVFLQKTQHLDVGRTRETQRLTLLHDPLRYSRPLPIGTHLSPLLVYKFHHLKIPIDGALQRGATTY